jgi:DNA (cytosine-5)-methyltransferase 1
MNNDKSTPNGGGQVGVCITGSKTHALTAMGADASEDGTGRGTPIVTADTIVRRLTPTECERLQGFPDGYTAIPGAKDGPRYKSLGNSMTTKVMRWIGQRIDVVDKVFNKSNQ